MPIYCANLPAVTFERLRRLRDRRREAAVGNRPDLRQRVFAAARQNIVVKWIKVNIQNVSLVARNY